MKSLKIKLCNLDYLQKIKLETLSNEHRLLYNCLLNQSKQNLDFKILNETYKNYRNNNHLTISSKSSQNTCRNLINSIKGFFALRKKDKTTKFPYKFKSWKQFCSFQLDFNQKCGGFSIKENKLEINLNSIKNKLTFDLPKIVQEKQISNKNIKTITFKKDEQQNYFLILVYSENKIEKISTLNKENFIALDLGISNLFTLTSNCIESFALINQKFDNLQKQIEFYQSKLDLKKKYSKKWKKMFHRFLRLKKRLANKNKDFQHKVSKNLIDKCINNNIGTIICGDIEVKKIIKKNDFKNKKSKKVFFKSTSKNFGLSRFKTFLEYKSKNEDIYFQKINEAYTSQTNSFTNKIEFKNLSLKDREVEIIENLKIDRDLNSAINIANKIKGKWLTQIEDFKNIIKNFHKIYMNSESKEFLYESNL